MSETSPSSPVLASTDTNPPKGGPGLNASLFLEPSPASAPSETEGCLAADDDFDSDDDNDNNKVTKRFGISASLVMITRLILFVLTLANIITWAVAGRLGNNGFVVVIFVELIFMLITNGCFILKLVRENRRSNVRGLNFKIPRISLAVGDWFCVLGGKDFLGQKWMDGDKKTWRVRRLLVRLFGVFIELYFGITLIVFTKCAFDDAWWYYLNSWQAPLIIGYVIGSFQLLAVILDQIKPLGRRTTIEIAYHSDGPVQKDYYIQLPVETEAEAGNPPMSIAA
ncbi:uncharacterized protein B0T23DRAFT_143544 [Neurospora hispaniola]|uniref:Uncharacterized protein n=1 Tax=Neurospora hispaniola TaxID=588809 RepID=A0AAJ0I7R3_9PEZI|nr:hypothetical protein B0T23DRAFT_143544 [Neurospora hispaniola]